MKLVHYKRCGHKHVNIEPVCRKCGKRKHSATVVLFGAPVIVALAVFGAVALLISDYRPEQAREDAAPNESAARIAFPNARFEHLFSKP